MLSKLLVIDDLNQNTKSQNQLLPKTQNHITNNNENIYKPQIANHQHSNFKPTILLHAFLHAFFHINHHPHQPKKKKPTIQGQINPDNNNTNKFITPNNNNNNKNTNDFCNSY
jgi:hypothetical protein